MTAIQATYHIWHNNQKFVPGTVITELEEKTAKQLVKDGAAVFVQAPILSETETKEIETPPMHDPSEDYKALDEDYSYEELKEQAGSVGLTFKGNISKNDLIHLIIEQGKMDEFFEDEV